jgi:hypothetical protein
VIEGTLGIEGEDGIEIDGLEGVDIEDDILRLDTNEDDIGEDTLIEEDIGRENFTVELGVDFETNRGFDMLDLLALDIFDNPTKPTLATDDTLLADTRLSLIVGMLNNVFANIPPPDAAL